MAKFKAAVLTKQHNPLDIMLLEEVGVSAGQVKVQMETSGLCGAQWNEINAVKGPDNYLPHLMGHEGYGQVLEVGDGVTKVKQGDFVVLHWRKGSGIDCFGPRYESNIGLIGSGSVTTFSEITIVSENRVSVVPKDDDLKYIYPLIGCALSTTWGIFKKEIKINKDSRILITGAGGLGLSLLFWAKIFGFSKIVVVDKYDTKQKYVNNFDVEFKSLESGFNLSDLKEKFDVIMDTTGDVSILEHVFTLLDKNAYLVLIGQPRKGEVLKLIDPLKFFDNIKLFASDGGGFNPDTDFNEIVQSIQNNKELVKNLVSHIISLDEVNEGFQVMKSGDCARIILDLKK
jgi:S-(hydroxymethyl)glutathione dehydrogenase / alcohol dehydrogenase